MMIGFFILLASGAMIMLAVKVSGLSTVFKHPGYTVTAEFDDIGGLKVLAPIKIAGVKIGEVTNISLDPVAFKAKVTLTISNDYKNIPNDSAASILTSGLLGDNYIALVPMYSPTSLINGDTINHTNAAFVLEKLIGSLLFKFNEK